MHEDVKVKSVYTYVFRNKKGIVAVCLGPPTCRRGLNVENAAAGPGREAGDLPPGSDGGPRSGGPLRGMTRGLHFREGDASADRAHVEIRRALPDRPVQPVVFLLGIVMGKLQET